MSKGFESFFKQTDELSQRVVKPVSHTFFKGNDGIIGNGYMLRANIRTALGNIAKTNAVATFQILNAVFHVERMHLKRGGIYHVARPCKLLM